MGAPSRRVLSKNPRNLAHDHQRAPGPGRFVFPVHRWSEAPDDLDPTVWEDTGSIGGHMRVW